MNDFFEDMANLFKPQPMETKTKLSAKEIKHFMTGEEWQLHSFRLVVKDLKGQIATCYTQRPYNECKANSAAIVSAVNNTYGKNINPEAVPELLRMLKCFVDVIDMIADSKGVMEERTREVYVTIQQSETYIQSRAAIEKATI